MDPLGKDVHLVFCSQKSVTLDYVLENFNTGIGKKSVFLENLVLSNPLLTKTYVVDFINYNNCQINIYYA